MARRRCQAEVLPKVEKKGLLEKEHSINNHEHHLSLKILPFLKGTKFVLLVQTHQERLTPAIYKHAIQTGTFYEAAK